MAALRIAGAACRGFRSSSISSLRRSRGSGGGDACRVVVCGGQALPLHQSWRCNSSSTAAAAQPLPPAVATHTVMNAAERAAATADDGAKFAVIQLGARQYKVTPGDIVVADYNAALEVGTTTELDQVLLVGSRTKTVVGRPLIENAKVLVSVEEHTKAKKVIVFKKKRRQGYKRKHGHRRQLTMLRVDDIITDTL